MTKGERIEYAIEKEVCRYSFLEWLEEWEIEKADFEKFMEAGKAVLTEQEDT